jgi:ABC-type nickel/cobalt efflux system permease component RcnA
MPIRALIRTALAAIIIAIVLSVSGGGWAQSPNPFRPAPTAPSSQAAPAPAPAPAPADQSFYAKALIWAVDFQRTMVRDIGRHMAAIRDGTSSYALFVGIGFAFSYGVIHTLGPGHGKMIVASYFVGRDAQILRGLWMGLQIAVTHVISAIVLVLAVDITFRAMLGGEPAQSWWIRLFSFSLIAIIGGTMLVNAIRASFGKQSGQDHDHHHHGHDHGHNHRHDGRSQGVLAVLAGLVPCTGAILVMLFALANGIVLAGVLMVVAISAGMALTMAAIGIAAILVRRVMLLVTGEGSPRGYIVATGLEYAAALLILAVGLSFLAGTIGEKFL